MKPPFERGGTAADPYAAAPLPAQIFLRAMLHRLTVSAVTKNAAEIPAIAVCPHLCWAAEIDELERVEVFNVETGTRFIAPVLYGVRGRIEVSPGFSAHVVPGDQIILSAYASVPPEDVSPKCGVIVWAQANRPLEIRRVFARTVRREPSYVPLPPRLEVVDRCSELDPVGVGDWTV